MRRLWLALMIGNSAWACSMLPLPVCDHWQGATHVVLADISGPVESIPRGKSAKARVLKTWKGTTAGEWITVQTLRSPCTSDEIKVGEKLVLFGVSSDNQTISAVWRRLPLEAAKQIGDIEYLDLMAFGNWFERQLVANKVCVFDFWKRRIAYSPRKN